MVAAAAPPASGPAWALPGAPLRLQTADSTQLFAWHLPPPAAAGMRVGVVMAHGFTGSWNRSDVRSVVAGLGRHVGVVAVDQRGHGGSTGLCTLGDREALDVDAAVAAARRLGYSRVATLGWSMGASGVLRHAGLTGELVRGWPVATTSDLVVAASGTSRWGVVDSVAMRRVTWLVTTRLGRQVARRMGVRVDASGWAAPEEWPLSPVEAAARLMAPLLVVHGEDDHYFGLEHPRALVEAARTAGVEAQLWQLPGFGHAEAAAAAHPDVVDRLGRHLVEALG